MYKKQYLNNGEAQIRVNFFGPKMRAACSKKKSQHPRPSDLDPQRRDPHLLAAPLRGDPQKEPPIPKKDESEHQTKRGLKPDAFLLPVRPTRSRIRIDDFPLRAQMFPRQGRIRAGPPGRKQENQNKIRTEKNRKEKNPKLA